MSCESQSWESFVCWLLVPPKPLLNPTHPHLYLSTILPTVFHTPAHQLKTFSTAASTDASKSFTSCTTLSPKNLDMISLSKPERAMNRFTGLTSCGISDSKSSNLSSTGCKFSTLCAFLASTMIGCRGWGRYLQLSNMTTTSSGPCASHLSPRLGKFHQASFKALSCLFGLL